MAVPCGADVVGARLRSRSKTKLYVTIINKRKSEKNDTSRDSLERSCSGGNFRTIRPEGKNGNTA
jgi:hypothetical protein